MGHLGTAARFLDRRYGLRRLLGHGGMADVWSGVDHRLGRSVTVKILRADLANEPQFIERFRREAQSAAAINHPSIVAIYDTGTDRRGRVDVPFIVMEYVEGNMSLPRNLPA